MAGQIDLTSGRPGKNTAGEYFKIVDVVERELSRGGFDVIRKDRKGVRAAGLRGRAAGRGPLAWILTSTERESALFPAEFL